MRLECSTAIAVRTPRNPCKAGKASRAFVALGMVEEPIQGLPEKYILVVRTRVRPTEKFEVSKANISAIHKNLVGQGKATIAFARPNVQLLISEAIPKRLEGVLFALDVIISKRRLKGVPPVKEVERTCDPSQLDNRPQQLSIKSQQNYPRGSNAFPESLLKLSITGVRLKVVDPRWFGLWQLISLDLSGNSFGKAWAEDPLFSSREWEKFAGIRKLRNLKHLDLSFNGFAAIEEEFYKALPISLLSLDVSNNELEAVSESIASLCNLQQLDLSSNRLETLPEDMYLLKRLRVLNVSGNLLGGGAYYPGTYFGNFGCRLENLEQLDLANNTAERGSPPGVNQHEGLITPAPLLSFAMAAVLNTYSLRQLEESLPSSISRGLRERCRRCSTCLRLMARGPHIRRSILSLTLSNMRLYSGPSLIDIEKLSCSKCAASSQ